jgi:hypothetical protein
MPILSSTTATQENEFHDNLMKTGMGLEYSWHLKQSLVFLEGSDIKLATTANID